MRIFEVASALGKKIRLTQVQWNHIIDDHREVENQVEKVKETISEPDLVCYDGKNDNFHYYRFYNEMPVNKKFILVIVKHLNSEGFVITVHFTRKIKKVDKIWRE